MIVSHRAVIIGWITWARHHPPCLKNRGGSCSSSLPGNHINPPPPNLITQKLILYNRRNSEKSKMSQPHINENTNLPTDPHNLNITHSFNTTSSIISNVGSNCTIADERSEILAWLSPLESQTRHEDIRGRRIEKVGDWFLQTEEYRTWLGGTSGSEPKYSALFCYGDPGVGKTYLR